METHEGGMETREQGQNIERVEGLRLCGSLGMKKRKKENTMKEQTADMSTRARQMEAETEGRCSKFQEGMTNGDEDLCL